MHATLPCWASRSTPCGPIAAFASTNYNYGFERAAVQGPASGLYRHTGYLRPGPGVAFHGCLARILAQISTISAASAADLGDWSWSFLFQP